MSDELNWQPWWQEHQGNSNLDPVLLVSGIGGTILEAVDQKGHRERVWVRILRAEHEFRTKLWSLYNPTTGLTESLNTNIQIEVPAQNYGLYAINILDPSVLLEIFHVDIIYNYHDMIQKMLNLGYKAGITLFGFGYDFRQSNRIPQVMGGLKEKLKTAYMNSGGKKVNIVSHSMGGLLVKCFLALHHEEFDKYVNKWIAIACPFQGAPAFVYEGLLTGVEFLNGIENELFISKTTIRQLLIECPSMYELLSAPGFQWKTQPRIQLWRKKYSDEGKSFTELESYGPDDCGAVLEEALANNTVDYDGNTIPLTFNQAILQRAKETLKILQTAKLPKGVKFYSIYGISFETPSDVCYGTEASPIQDVQEILQLKPEFSYVDGDGTVPSESALADGLDAEARLGLPFSHRDLLCENAVFKVLWQWLGVGDSSERNKFSSDFVILSKMHLVDCSIKACKTWDTISEDSENYNEAVEADSLAKVEVNSEGYGETALESHVTVMIHASSKARCMRKNLV